MQMAPQMLLLCVMLTSAAVLSLAQPRDTFAYVAFVNDVHNRLEEEEPSTATPCQPATQAEGRCVGGWARISTEIKSLRRQAARERAAFWFLDAGDEFTGTLWDVIYKGQITPFVQKQVKQDAMVLGNHEFDYGNTNLASYIRNVSSVIPVLGACNIDTSEDPDLKGLLQRFVILQHKAGKRTFKVGVLGWSTSTTGVTAPSVGKVKFKKELPAVRACLKQLQQQHKDLDYIIGLSHAGYESDLEVAKGVSGLDVIIGGHSHTFLYTPTTSGPIVTRKPGVNRTNCVSQGACDKPMGPYPTYVGRVPVVQAYYSSKYLGLIKINLSRKKLVPGIKPLLLGGSNSSRNVQQDPAVTALLAKYSEPVEALKKVVAGSTQVPLVGDASIMRRNETNLGSYACDAFLRAVPEAVQQRTGNVTICIINAGSIRAGIEEPGNFTVAQVMAMLPYASSNAIFTITGQSLIDAIKNGLSQYPTAGRFPQVSGIRYFHNNGAYLSAVLLNPDGSTSPINPQAKYTITAVDYILTGGDGYDFNGADVVLPAGEPYAQLIMADMQKFPEGIAPTTHDRIINCGLWQNFPGCPASSSS